MDINIFIGIVITLIIVIFFRNLFSPNNGSYYSNRSGSSFSTALLGLGILGFIYFYSGHNFNFNTNSAGIIEQKLDQDIRKDASEQRKSHENQFNNNKYQERQMVIDKSVNQSPRSTLTSNKSPLNKRLSHKEVNNTIHYQKQIRRVFTTKEDYYNTKPGKFFFEREDLDLTKPFYSIQTNAYSLKEYAIHRVTELKAKYGEEVFLVEDSSTEKTPYKVCLRTFPNKEGARFFLKNNSIDGFPIELQWEVNKH